jgi:tetratricopeptide (TPR) repeat protein
MRVTADEPLAGTEWLKRASAYSASGDASAALLACDRAAALGVPAVLLNISRSTLALTRGDAEAACAHARAALDADPNSAAAHINAAIVEGPRFGYERALARLDVAARLCPGAPGLPAVRATALFKLMRYEAALAEAEKACAAAPRDAGAHELRVMALKALGRDAEAIAVLERPEVLALGTRLRIGLAIAQMDLGRRNDARTTLRTALERDPLDSHAWYVLADLDDFDTAGRDIAAMERAQANAPNVFDRIHFDFALGKAHLARADHARAFTHFRSGNERKRSLLTYDVAVDERVMAESAEEFSAGALAAGLSGAHESDRPVFVVGMPRSGTSLVEQVLASHPAVFGAGELPALGLIAATRAATPRTEWPSLAAQYLQAAGARAGDARRIVDKLPLNFVNAGFIRLLFPNARIIHCRRDPVDNALSCYTTLFNEGHEFSYDLVELGRFARAYAQLMDHWRATIEPDRLLEVDYETLVADFEPQARRLVAFCGLPWDAAVLRFHQTARSVRTASKMQVRRPIYSSSVGRAAAFGDALDPLRAALGGPGRKNFGPSP